MEDTNRSQPNIDYRFRENVTTQEYEEAVKLLNEFKDVNLDDVISLSELTLPMKGVGDALSKIAYAKGKLTPEKYYDYRPGMDENAPKWDEIDELPEEATGTAISLRAVGGEFVVLTNKSIPYGAPPTEKDYEVLIPTSPVNNPSENISDSMIGAYIFNVDKNEWIDYLPRKEHTPEVVKVYAQLIKQGVTDLLATNLPSPTEVPQAFYTQ